MHCNRQQRPKKQQLQGGEQIEHSAQLMLMPKRKNAEESFQEYLLQIGKFAAKENLGAQFKIRYIIDDEK